MESNLYKEDMYKTVESHLTEDEKKFYHGSTMISQKQDNLLATAMERIQKELQKLQSTEQLRIPIAFLEELNSKTRDDIYKCNPQDLKNKLDECGFTNAEVIDLYNDVKSEKLEATFVSVLESCIKLVEKQGKTPQDAIKQVEQTMKDYVRKSQSQADKESSGDKILENLIEKQSQVRSEVTSATSQPMKPVDQSPKL